MSVYFVYRCHYNNPSEKHLRVFDEDSILDWFRNRWNRWSGQSENAIYDAVGKELGQRVYSFPRLFIAVNEENIDPPETDEQLDQILQEHVYINEILRVSSHAVQIGSDDDELEVAYFFFDDQFVSENPEQTSFLLHKDWKLTNSFEEGNFTSIEETKLLTPSGDGTGTTYCVFLAYYDSGNFDLEGGYRFEGIRLPEFAQHLSTSTPTEDWPFELRALRSQLFKEHADLTQEESPFWLVLRESPDIDNWSIYQDWLEEHGGSSTRVLEHALHQMTNIPVAPICNTLILRDFGTGTLETEDQQLQKLKEKANRDSHDPAKSLIAVDQHIAQMCLHTDDWSQGDQPEDLYHQWIFFDDLWASANSGLANAILRFAKRWDVLSPDG